MAARSSAETRREASYSGRLLLRMPRALHADLAARADTEGVSLNQYIVGALTKAVGAAPAAAGERRGVPRSVRIALIVNAVVVALAAATAIVLLVAGLR